jgi:hypothetical protein
VSHEPISLIRDLLSSQNRQTMAQLDKRTRRPVLRISWLDGCSPYRHSRNCLPTRGRPTGRYAIVFRSLSPISYIVPDYPHSLRYSSLPSENVCTENLTPFAKLLPCKAHAGIASLLNSHRLFDADWHGMSITVRWLENVGVELRLGFGAVMDPVRLSEDSMRRGSYTFGPK